MAMNMRTQGSFPGVSFALVTAVVLYVVAMLIGKSYGAAFFAIPFFVGLGAGFASQEKPYRNALIAFVLAVLLSVAFLREGVICLLFALPIFLPGLLAGAACGARARTGRSPPSRLVNRSCSRKQPGPGPITSERRSPM